MCHTSINSYVPYFLEGVHVTNAQKRELRQLAKEGLSFKEIREIVDCNDSTIRNYIKVFRGKPL